MKSTESTYSRKPRVRTWMTVGLTSFVTVGLLLLLMFQTLFLDDLYEFSKIRTVKNAANEIAQALLDGDVEEHAEYWSVKEECTIYILNAEGETSYSYRSNANDGQRLNQAKLRSYYDATVSKGGTLFLEMQTDLARHEILTAKSPKDEKPGGDRQPPFEKRPKQDNVSKNEVSKSVIYAVLSEKEVNGKPLLVLVTSALTPVDATVRVLQMQLVIAIVLFVGLAAALAWFMAKNIASPIIHINRAAKGLPNGTYRPPQEGGYREITELRDTLTAIDGELRKSEQLQRDLIANVSHDLRTPLTMIIGYGEAIRDLPGEDSAENIQVVIDEAERLTHLVNDVLDLSKLQSGVEQFDMTPTRLTEILQDVVSRLGRMMAQDGYTIRLIAEEEVTVSADEVRLSQIIYNLLNNALTHTGEDRCVTVTQTVTEHTVRVSFTDSGKGIPEEELSNIWLRYYQVHSHERRHTMNSGLGLSIVYALVQRHGGTCGVDSTVGKGSTFWFELPRI